METTDNFEGILDSEKNKKKPQLLCILHLIQTHQIQFIDLIDVMLFWKN
jgi:hypothetical protein